MFRWVSRTLGRTRLTSETPVSTITPGPMCQDRQKSVILRNSAAFDTVGLFRSRERVRHLRARRPQAGCYFDNIDFSLMKQQHIAENLGGAVQSGVLQCLQYSKLRHARCYVWIIWIWGNHGTGSRGYAKTDSIQPEIQLLAVTRCKRVCGDLISRIRVHRPGATYRLKRSQLRLPSSTFMLG